MYICVHGYLCMYVCICVDVCVSICVYFCISLCVICICVCGTSFILHDSGDKQPRELNCPALCPCLEYLGVQPWLSGPKLGLPRPYSEFPYSWAGVIPRFCMAILFSKTQVSLGLVGSSYLSQPHGRHERKPLLAWAAASAQPASHKASVRERSAASAHAVSAFLFILWFWLLACVSIHKRA